MLLRQRMKKNRERHTLNSSNSIVVRATARSSIFVAQKSNCARPTGACRGILFGFTYYLVSKRSKKEDGREEIIKKQIKKKRKTKKKKTKE